MLAKVITLSFDPITHEFPDLTLIDFIKDKKVIGIKEHFFESLGSHYLAIFITYENATMKVPREEKTSDTSWKAILSQDAYPLFNTLRDWRKQRASEEGVPPYMICNNSTLALITKDRPQSLEHLGKIQGFGNAKLEKYGKDMLVILSKEMGT